MKRRVRVENPLMVAEATGGQTPDPAGTYPLDSGWVSAGTFWAEVLDVGARERLALGQLDSGLNTTITMRKNSAIHAHSRLILGDRVLYVSGPPIEDSRGESVTLTCQERKD